MVYKSRKTPLSFGFSIIIYSIYINSNSKEEDVKDATALNVLIT